MVNALYGTELGWYIWILLCQIYLIHRRGQKNMVFFILPPYLPSSLIISIFITFECSV